LNQPFSLLRLLITIPLLLIFLWAQRYWFLRAWRLAGRAHHLLFRRLLRTATVSGFVFVALVLAVNVLSRRRDFVWRYSGLVGVVGLWISTALFAYLLVQGVAGAAWVFRRVRRLLSSSSSVDRPEAARPRGDSVELGRRRFVQAATVLAGAVPFGAGAYGFLIGRHRYQVSEIDIPVNGLARELEGLRIGQLSDIHVGSYMSVAEVRRVVAMTNELRPDLIVVTGDFITGANDPLEQCIAELSRLRAPLGVWGCNGNHEIYADVESLTPELFRRYGMRLLRQESAELAWNGEKLNLIGVDYQRTQDFDGQPLLMLDGAESLMRRDMPNILLSHNPNSFPRAAELGMDLMLAGHTHGGQVRVEILDHRFSFARFLTPYVAGMYRRPLGSAAALEDDTAWSAAHSSRSAVVYVNRGLGTIFAPVRIGVPPEISLLTLRKA